jgi:acetyl esterase/lipase
MSSIPFLAALAAALRVELVRDIEIGRVGQRPLRMHMARPKRRRGRMPAVAFIFGGGWRSGDPDQGLLVITALAFRGFVAASIDYRLSAEATFPAQIHDCKCAIRYLRACADDYMIDPDRIGVVGVSSGGHLAALLGTTAGNPDFEETGGWPGERSDVQAVAEWSAPVDFVRIAREHGNLQSSDTMTARLVGGPLLEKADLVKAANPISHVSGRTPPFFIAHGLEDQLVPPTQSQILHEALQLAGVQSELVLLAGKGHGFLGLGAARRTLAFLERELKPR